MNDNIKGIKLINGYEMIAKIVSESDKSFVLEDAIFWDIVRVGEEKYDIQFVPLSNGLKIAHGKTHPAIDLELPKSTVLFSYEARDEIVDRYKQLVCPIMLLNNKIQ